MNLIDDNPNEKGYQTDKENSDPKPHAITPG
jgi:hypothetical protein